MATDNKNTADLAPYGRDSNDEAFGPNPTQARVLAWVDAVKRGEKKAKGIPVLLLKGGVGSGKTRGIMAPVQELLFEYPGIRIFWGRQDFKDIKLSVMEIFTQTMPDRTIINKSEQYHWYDVWTGKGKPNSRITFDGVKDLSGFGSQEFAVVVITEAHETAEMAYRTLKRRCRQSGFPVMILMESEPPNESHWIERLTNPALDEFDPDIEMWELSTYENWDNLPETYRTSLESMPKAWQRKYLYGKSGFIPDGRPFYEGFREELHTGDFTYNALKPLITGWDFGFHHPSFTVHQIDDMGRWYVLAELLGNEITIDKFCDQVKTMINTRFPQATSWIHYGDPACAQHNDKSEKTSWQVCKEKGFDIKCRQSTYRTRKEIIDGKLSKIINGKPTMLVDKSCRILIDGLLGGYHYPERSPGQANNDNFEVPFRDGYYEHVCNAVEYVAINVFRAVERHTDDRMRKYKYRSRTKETANAGFSFSS
jgi:PBSX family phage terminase large subunit